MKGFSQAWLVEMRTVQNCLREDASVKFFNGRCFTTVHCSSIASSMFYFGKKHRIQSMHFQCNNLLAPRESTQTTVCFNYEWPSWSLIIVGAFVDESFVPKKGNLLPSVFALSWFQCRERERERFCSKQHSNTKGQDKKGKNNFLCQWFGRLEEDTIRKPGRKKRVKTCLYPGDSAWQRLNSRTFLCCERTELRNSCQHRPKWLASC